MLSHKTKQCKNEERDIQKIRENKIGDQKDVQHCDKLFSCLQISSVFAFWSRFQVSDHQTDVGVKDNQITKCCF